jgi:hypothetical protein
MSLRYTVLLFCLALAIGGGELLYQSSQTPEWVDSTKAEEVQSWPLPSTLNGPDYDAYNKRWAGAIDALRTEKWPLKDAGATLMMLGLSLAAGLFLLRIRTVDDVAQLKTPKRRRTIYVAFTLAWFGYWVSAAAAMVQGFNRFEFPTWADNMLVPMFWMGAFAVVGWILLSISAWFALRRSQLPAPMWVWRKDMPLHDWIYTVAAAVAIALGLEVLRETYFYGHWSAVPAALLLIYTAFAFRAAGIAKETTPSQSP